MKRLLLCLALVGGCADRRTSADDYRDFRDRTATQRSGETCERALAFESQVADIRGRWLVRTLLTGGITLGLRLDIDWAEGEDGVAPVDIVARFWLASQNPDETDPILVTPATVDEKGMFTLVADPLRLGAELLNAANPVVASVRLHGLTQGPSAWCGTLTGTVTSPLELGLDGSTFAATRDDHLMLSLEAQPFACPMTECGEGAADGGVELDGGGGDAGVTRPAAPDLSGIEGQRIDLTGDWIMSASLGGLPLQLWVGLLYHTDPIADVASLDGIIRLTRDETQTPGRVFFTIPIDDAGRFDIWLPGFVLDTGVIVVEGDILLSAVALDDQLWCGKGAGSITSPFPLDLADTTFSAVRWAPGTELPDGAGRACPAPTPPD